MSHECSTPIDICLNFPADPDAKDSVPLIDSMRQFYCKDEFTDIALLSHGQTFLAHRIVLATSSSVFMQAFGRNAGQMHQADTCREELRLDSVSPEAVKLMLDYMYHIEVLASNECISKTEEIIVDVLRLAHDFRLSGLTSRATHWLATTLTTTNVLTRLKLCEDFGLEEFGDRILEELSINKLALYTVATSLEIMDHPRLLQILLQRAVAMTIKDDTSSAAYVTEHNVDELQDEKISCGAFDVNSHDSHGDESAESTVKLETPPDLPANSIIVLTEKVPATPYIAKRAKQLAGRTVEQVLTTGKFVDADGQSRKYRVADLRYDLRRRFLSLASVGA